jgi:adenine C2-methylase RlmN of 23S rRNA A2503 and tRNA A37
MQSLPKDLRQEIDERYVFDAFEIRDAIDSTDGGTEKLLLELQDGARIEAVLNFNPGGLRDGMRILCDGSNGVWAQPYPG